MTPVQLDHLRRIDAHLANLLSTAEKRTPGEWMKSNFNVFTDSEEAKLGAEGHHIADCDPANDKTVAFAQSDAAFIASCAGNAEAGWKATRAAIATALDCESWDAMIKEMYIRQDAEAILESILTAFPNV